MDLMLRNRVALITGGASGIGLACVEAVLEEGAKAIIVDRNPAGRDLAQRLENQGHDVEFVQADITQESDVRESIKAARNRFGQLDVVMACAGISGPVGLGIEDITAEDWDQVMAINVRGNFLLAKHAMPLLSQSEIAAMVLLASDSAMVAFEGMAPYTASKGAVLMLTKALAVEHPGVRVNCLCPSIVDTPMSRTDLGQDEGFAGSPLPVMQPEQVAAHAIFLVSPLSAPINGTSLVADHGYLARSAQPTLNFS